jgi:hypothetical protein
MVLLTSASEAMRSRPKFRSPGKTPIPPEISTFNRFDSLADRAPSPSLLSGRSNSFSFPALSSQRDRSSSAKRKANDDPLPPAKAARNGSTSHSIEGQISNAMHLFEKAKASLMSLSSSPTFDPALAAIIDLICDGMLATNAIQVELNSKLLAHNPPITQPSSGNNSLDIPQSASAARAPLKQAPLGNNNLWSTVTARNKPSSRTDATISKVNSTGPPVSPAPTVIPQCARFSDVVRNAERSILLVNLDLGNSPIINPKNISSKVTNALLSLAAKVEAKLVPENREAAKGNPSPSSISLLDDILSMAMAMKLFGKVTSPCRNMKDPALNGSFYTIPVCLEFADKDSRNRIDSMLREHCGITSLVPYPGILRSCIKATLDHFKSIHPDNFVKVTVDHTNLCLKVSHRIKDGSSKPYWKSSCGSIILPELVLDTSARVPPVGTDLVSLLKLNTINHSGNASQDMDLSGTLSSQEGPLSQSLDAQGSQQYILPAPATST